MRATSGCDVECAHRQTIGKPSKTTCNLERSCRQRWADLPSGYRRNYRQTIQNELELGKELPASIPLKSTYLPGPFLTAGPTVVLSQADPPEGSYKRVRGRGTRGGGHHAR